MSMDRMHTTSSPLGSWSRRAVIGAVGAALMTGRLSGRRRVRADEQIISLNQLPGQPVEGGINVGGRLYGAYIDLPIKEGQDFYYTCEFDASWIVLRAYGIEATLDDQLAIIGQDDRVEPYYEETADGVLIHGGDIGKYFSGDYRSNFLARTTGRAFGAVFEAFGLQATPVNTRSELKAALQLGQPVWMKATVDFKPWVPATWVTPHGRTYPTVLGNDHALVVMGYHEDGVVIRDPLGPTDTNWNRTYEYEVDWTTFMEVWKAQGRDGLAVGPALAE